MKKIISFALALLLIASMAIPAYAVTPNLGAPDVPQISNMKFDIKIELPEDILDDWFKNHPISWKPVIEIPKTEIDVKFIDALKNATR